MLPDNIGSALADIARRLDREGVSYCVGGSAMLASHGLEVSVGDIDLVVGESGRQEIEALFDPHVVRDSLDPWRSEWFLSSNWSVVIWTTS